MKRMITVVLTICMLLALVSCSRKTEQEETKPDTKAETGRDAKTDTNIEPGTKPENSGEGRRVLVAYFSCTGTTEQIAGWIAEANGADIYQITPAVPYSTEDLDYGNDSSRANTEQGDSSARPEITGAVENMGDYETVFLGYPIWHGQAPRIISTFLESYDFSEKTIIPFCTSHSSGIGSSDTNLHELCPDSVTWISGERFDADTVKDAVSDWVMGLNIS